MKTRSLLLVLALGAFACFVDSWATQIRFPTPAQWSVSVDPQSQAPMLLAPNGSAALTFIASTPFTGTAQEWQNDRWSRLTAEVKPTKAPLEGTMGIFRTRTAILERADGTRPWICLYTTVANGRGEGFVFLALDKPRYLAQLNALNDAAQRASIEPVAPEKTTAPASPSPSASTKTAPASPPAVASTPKAELVPVAGLYLATTRQLRFNPLGGSGSADWEVRTEYYLLAADGQVFRGRDLPSVPGGDLRRFDFAAARREAPGNYGAYELRGDHLVLRLGDNPVETIEARRLGADQIEIRETKFTRSVTAPAGTTSPR